MIDKSLVKKLIAEYQNYVTGIKLIPRDIVVDYSHCNVFVGLRRAGKSYLMYQCIHHFLENGASPQSFLYFNFEDDRLADLTVGDLDTVKLCYEEMYADKPVFFLDELQVVKGWEKFARRLADTGYQVFITGSNANMLSSEIATTLGGRYALTEVFPFSFKEYLDAKQIKLKSNWQYLANSDVKRAFNEYFTLGGLPEIVETQPQFKRKWLSGLFDRIYFGDLVARNGIRKHDSLKSLIRKLVDSIGQPLSVNRAASIVASSGTSLKPETAADYIGYMNQAWLTFSVENYIGKLADKLSLKKYYYIDNGLISLFRDSMNDALLENLVAVSLRKRFGADFYYFRHNVELDFYVPEASLGIQVCYTLEGESTMRREVAALSAVHQFKPLEKALIVTYDEEGETVTDEGLNIEIIPVWKWLLLQSAVS